MDLLKILAQLNGSSPAPKTRSLKGADLRQLRGRLMLSQEGFARRYGFTLTTLRNWEQGLRQPDAAVRAYLTVISRDPKRVAALFNGASPETLAQLTLRELTAALDAADREDAAKDEEDEQDEEGEEGEEDDVS